MMGIGSISRVAFPPGLSWRPPWYLRPGQMVMVETVSVTGPGAVVRIAGQTFNARGELPAAPATFWALVEAITGETLHLRRISNALTEEMTPEDLARLLELPPDRDTVNLLREMLKYRLPLERRFILRLLAEGHAFPEEERDAFWAARLYLENLDLREDAAKLRLAADYLVRSRTAREPTRELAAGQELLNAARPLTPGADLLRFFTFWGPEGSGEAFLVEKDGGSSENSLLAGIIVQVSSPVLGETWICLIEDAGGYTLRVAVSQEWAAIAMEALEILKTRLGELGYRVASASVSTRPVRTVFDALQDPETTGYRPVNAIV
ncbi:MAG: hypothetical protein ACUVTA_01880 [Thermodesulfitimonas sp.]